MKLVRYTWRTHDSQTIEMSGAFETAESFELFRHRNVCIGDQRKAKSIVMESMRDLTEAEETLILKEFDALYAGRKP